MILTKQFLNELKDQKKVHDSVSLLESRFQVQKHYDVFFSYSSHNQKFALMIVQLLQQAGYSVYIDVYDNRLQSKELNKNVAKILASVMNKCSGLIYLHSSSAKVSKWCPWELGYFSGKHKFMCANMPLTNNDEEKYEGQEYLNMYKQVEYEKIKGTSKYQFWVFDNSRHYVTLREWLDEKWQEKRRK
jgi:hypothetical protein